MSNLTSTPYDWLRQIPKELKSIDEVPLWGHPPPFPWEKLKVSLSKALQIKFFDIKPTSFSWREAEKSLEGLGENPLETPFALTPLKGLGYWLISKSALENLARTFFKKEDLSSIDESLIQGFQRFLSLEASQAFQTCEFDKALSLQLLSPRELPTAPSFCIDLECQIEEHAFPSRLLISQDLRKSFKDRYGQTNLTISPSLYQKVEVTLELVAGSTVLTREEWKSASAGDVLLLDSCSLSPQDDKGRIMLAINGLPIFRGKIKDGNIKILEYPLFHEVQTPMNPKDFEDDEESESETEFTEDEEDFDDDEDFSEEHSDFDDEEEEHLTEEEEDELTEDSEHEHEDSEEEVEEEESSVKAPAPAPLAKGAEKSTEKTEAKPSAALPKATRTDSHSMVKPDEIPLTISVEVGRLQITIEKLMELQPGNLLELDVHPENGVDLVINGKCVAKGELLQIGEALGVRILDKI